jgi:hypothetical protein
MIQVTKINISYLQKAKSRRFTVLYVLHNTRDSRPFREIFLYPVFLFSLSAVTTEMGVLRQQDAVAKRQTKERVRYEKNRLAESYRELKKGGETQSH